MSIRSSTDVHAPSRRYSVFIHEELKNSSCRCSSQPLGAQIFLACYFNRLKRQSLAASWLTKRATGAVFRLLLRIKWQTTWGSSCSLPNEALSWHANCNLSIYTLIAHLNNGVTLDKASLWQRKWMRQSFKYRWRRRMLSWRANQAMQFLFHTKMSTTLFDEQERKL